MELRQLRQFVVLAETLNFHRAAERLHMAQPPLSTAMRKLEEELGIVLFDRDPRGLKLTVAGGIAL
uniref:helix-turn-helix domain-containing protein n=2 Tax=Bacteria TaxID=2 RepID=UPI00119FE65F